jgi:hypothetical protein
MHRIYTTITPKGFGNVKILVHKLVATKARSCLPRLDKKTMHSIDEKEWLLVWFSINTNGELISNFYIFKSKQFICNYIVRCASGSTMVMQLKAWMTTCLFSNWISHFIAKMEAQGGNMSIDNKHFLIFYGHNSHITVDVA